MDQNLEEFQNSISLVQDLGENSLKDLKGLISHLNKSVIGNEINFNLFNTKTMSDILDCYNRIDLKFFENTTKKINGLSNSMSNELLNCYNISSYEKFQNFVKTLPVEKFSNFESIHNDEKKLDCEEINSFEEKFDSVKLESNNFEFENSEKILSGKIKQNKIIDDYKFKEFLEVETFELEETCYTDIFKKIEESLIDNPAKTQIILLNILSELISIDDNKNVEKLLMIFSHLDYFLLDVGIRRSILAISLNSKCRNVVIEGIRCIEYWEDPSDLKFLDKIKFKSKFVSDYIKLLKNDE